MTVSIPCASCSRQINFGRRACSACGRSLSSDEIAALESRFEAMHTDYRNEKADVFRALAVALAAGLMTIAVASLRLFLDSTSELAAESPTQTAAVGDVVLGLSLATCWLGRRRLPTLAVAAALGIWTASFAKPFLVSPAIAILAFMSPTGVALTLARLAVFFILVRGIPAGIRMRRFVKSAT